MERVHDEKERGEDSRRFPRDISSQGVRQGDRSGSEECGHRTFHHVEQRAIQREHRAKIERGLDLPEHRQDEIQQGLRGGVDVEDETRIAKEVRIGIEGVERSPTADLPSLVKRVASS
jgi:hypothetical protein